MRPARRFVAAFLFVSAAATAASAQTALLRDVPEPQTSQPLLRDGVLRARIADADVAALRALQPAPPGALASVGSTVTLALFDDVQVTVTLERRDDLADGAITFVGGVVGEPLGRAAFAIVDDALAADVVLPQGRYEVRYRADGHHDVQAVDGRFVCGTVHSPEASAAAALARVDLPVLEGAPVVVDVLFAYTPRAATIAGGTAGVRSAIHLAVQSTNDAFARSLVAHRIRAVHITPTQYVETGLYTGSAHDMDRLTNFTDGFMDELPVLRESVQADLVHLIAGPATDAGGVGQLMTNFDPMSGGTFGYAVSSILQLTGTVPHELGHNLSLHHDPETTPNAGTLLPYGIGYRIPGKFGTIMAYPCPAPQAACPGINNYSNPAVLFNGTPTGVANVNEEARALIQTMPVAASFRGCRVRRSPADALLRFGPAARTVSIDVTTDSECAWTVREISTSTWITRTSPVPVRNSGALTFAVAANPTPSDRAHYIEMSGEVITIEQRACLQMTSPTLMHFSEAGGTGAMVIDAVPGCAWRFDAPAPGSMITPTSPLSGSGSGQLTFTVAAAPAQFPFGQYDALFMYSGSTYVAGASIVRDGTHCAGGVAIAPTAFETSGAGGNVTVTVTAPPSCTWQLTGTPSWITPAGSATGTGSGSVTLSLPPNTGDFTRRAWPSISGRIISATQLACAATPQIPAQVTAAGGRVDMPITAASTCTWWARVPSTAMRVEHGSVTGPGVLRLSVSPNPDLTVRQLVFTVNNRSYAVTQAGRASLTRRYLSEGATGSFFSTRLALLNPGDTPVDGQFRFQRSDGAVGTRSVTVPARRRMTITPESVPGFDATDFATVLESDGLLLLDRTMSWDRSGFGTHAETALTEPSRTWYLAEGATTGDFSLFYLLQNPNPTATVATITFLLPGGVAPIVRTFPLSPSSRRTIPIDTLGPPLDAADVSAVITAPDPIIVERAMYATRAGQSFAAGHNSAGVTAPALEWFLAEGATGTFFDLFVLIANPNPAVATLTAEYLLPDGRVLTKDYTVLGNSRATIWVDDEQIPAGSGQKPLAAVSVSTTVRSTNGVPVIVERAMWWPGPQVSANYWTEAHNSPGATVTGTRWGLGEGEVGGPNDSETFILIANTSTTEGTVRVQLLFEDGTSAERTLTVPARSRTTVSGTSFPQAAHKRFGAIVESLGAAPAQIVVERAMYSSPNGVFWSAGTNALATRLAP